MIVVDGRTDEEKLLELLGGGAEETALDFKSTLDLSGRASKDSVEFAKDAITMGNLPTGGYIVVGVGDDGQPAHEHAAVEPAQFDSAALRAKVARFVEAPVSIVSQSHQVDGRAIILVYVAPNPDGLPVPTSSIGQYNDSTGRSVTVFREGEVLIREGTSNVRLRYAHWHGLLERYRNQVREEARRDSDDLIRRVVAGLRDGDGAGGGAATRIPLDSGMDGETLSQALVVAFDSGSTVRVQQFLNDATIRAGSGPVEERDQRLAALDQIASVACQSVLYRQDEVYRSAIAGLERAYLSRGLANEYNVRLHGDDRDRAQHYLDVFVRVLAIGALVVRRQQWDLLSELAVRPIKQGSSDWPTWLRHAVTMAARANLMREAAGNASGGEVLSLTRALVAANPSLRPDYGPDVPLSEATALAQDDWLLNSLCEFDLWWCLLAVASSPDTRRESAAFYPSCAAFHQPRSQPTLSRIATEQETRRVAFRDVSDEVIANAMVVVVDVAVGQSHQYGGWWDGLSADPAVAAFVAENATKQP